MNADGEDGGSLGLSLRNNQNGHDGRRKAYGRREKSWFHISFDALRQ